MSAGSRAVAAGEPPEHRHPKMKVCCVISVRSEMGKGV